MVQFHTLSLCPGGYRPRLPLGGAGIAAQRSAGAAAAGRTSSDTAVGRQTGKAGRQAHEDTKKRIRPVDYALSHTTPNLQGS
jgi:hypothetical protein